MKKLVMAVGLFAALALDAAPEFKGLADAKEINARDGVGHLMEKIKAGKEITVAYLGGSITAMGGWRNMTTDWLRQTYTNAVFKEVHAAIGGTGSGLGVFRLRDDALRHNPDLLFVEFATNDGGAAPKTIWRQMEGIVRQTWRNNPTTDIVFTYTICDNMRNEYLAGKCNRAASAMEQLADYYGIPSIGFGPRVAKLLAENKLIMGTKEIETAVPKEDPEHDRKVKEMLANDPRILFSNDGVHPRKEGHEIYLQSIIAGFTAMQDSKPADHAAKLAGCFVEDHMEAAKMVPVTAAMLTGEWTKLPPDDPKSKNFSPRLGEIWHTGTPGSALKFKFKGTKCAIYDIIGPDGGQIAVTVDGKAWKKMIPRFDSYCTYWRLAGLTIYDGSDGVHEVEITVDKDQPSRQSVAFRLKDPEKELASPKYQGTNFWIGKLQLLGDIVE